MHASQATYPLSYIAPVPQNFSQREKAASNLQCAGPTGDVTDTNSACEDSRALEERGLCVNQVLRKHPNLPSVPSPGVLRECGRVVVFHNVKNGNNPNRLGVLVSRALA